MADTGTYLFIVVIGFILTLIVGQFLIRAGHGFLRDVFDDDDVASSTTRLLAVLFHLVALGFLALVSTYQPIKVEGTIQLIVTQLGGVLLVLGILHGLTLLLLARVRSRRRTQTLEESLSTDYDQQRRQSQRQQTQRQQVIEAGGTGSNPTNGGPR